MYTMTRGDADSVSKQHSLDAIIQLYSIATRIPYTEQEQLLACSVRLVVGGRGTIEWAESMDNLTRIYYTTNMNLKL